jgi:hypothetical protein
LNKRTEGKRDTDTFNVKNEMYKKGKYLVLDSISGRRE